MTTAIHFCKTAIVLCVIILTSNTQQLFAQNKLRIAVAANLHHVIKILQADFKKKTGITTEAIASSSGKLVAQINNGAPYDIFLSADMDFPNALYKNNQTTGPPEIYALGKLMICSTQKLNLQNWSQLLLSPAVKKIAIANPQLAPYGEAAKQALIHSGIFEQIKSKLVYGESISQVNTYILTGVVNIGFTSASLQAESKIPMKSIEVGHHTPIKQGMVILKNRRNLLHAEEFYKYMLSSDAKKILRQNGYSTN